MLVAFALGQPQTPDHYDTPQRRVTLTIDLDNRGSVIPMALFGLNLSYFNDTDEIWETHQMAASLERAGVGALRYPGGEETSFYSWRHPGVNGYEDVHADPATHGTPPDRGPFQVTWVDPKEWATNERFMSFDEFMEHCRAIGAAPFVGINMSSGRAHDRMEACLDDAVDLVRHSVERWGPAREGGVQYWFLDNEPWHGKAAYTFDIEREYVADVVTYSRAIKAVDPDAEIVVNPFSAESYNSRDFAVRVIRAMGDAIDHVDVHWYPGWGLSTWESWATAPAMDTGTKWKPAEHHRTFAEDFELLRGIFADASRPDLGLMALEWNIGPNEPLVPLSDTAFALMHAEMLITFIGGELEAACLWTNLWRSRREVWPEQDLFPTLHNQQPPFAPTRTHDVFRMLSQMAGGKRVAAVSDAADLVVTAAHLECGAPLIAMLNKSPMRRCVDLQLTGSDMPQMVTVESFGVRHSGVDKATSPWPSGGDRFVFVEPYSFALVRGGTGNAGGSGMDGGADAQPASDMAPRPLDADWIIRAHERIARDLDRLPLEDVDVVFVGDSITQEWLDAGAESWRDLWAGRGDGRIGLNLGMSGDRTEHVIHRLSPRSGGGLGQLSREGLSPRAVVLMIGTNNLYVHSAQQIIDGTGAVVRRIQAAQPESLLILCTLLPTADPAMNRELIAPVNRWIRTQRALPTVAVLDLDPTFARGEQGRDDSLFRDDLHLNAKGYAAWAHELRPLLDSLSTYP